MTRLALIAALVLVGCGEPTPAQVVIDSATYVEKECLQRCLDAAVLACVPQTGISLRGCSCGEEWTQVGFGCFEAYAEPVYYDAETYPLSPRWHAAPSWETQ